MSRNGGAWKTLTLSSRLATAVNKRMTLGSTYRFRVRAKDRAGNTGAWTYSVVVKPKKYDDGTSAAKWSAGWSRVASVGRSAATSGRPALGGRTASFTFTGSAVGVLAPRGPNLGFAQVYVDGVLKATINLSAPSAAPSRVIWSKSWPSKATHKVRIGTLGTVGHPAWTVDAFVVLW